MQASNNLRASTDPFHSSRQHRHLLVRRADDDAVGAEGVFDGRSLAQEFGVRDHVEGHGPALVTLDDVADELAGAHRDRRFVDDDGVALHRLPDLAGDLLDGAEIGLTILLGGRAHRDEDDDRPPDGRGQVGAEGEPAVGDVARHHLLEPGLVDGDPAGL